MNLVKTLFQGTKDAFRDIHVAIKHSIESFIELIIIIMDLMGFNVKISIGPYAITNCSISNLSCESTTA